MSTVLVLSRSARDGSPCTFRLMLPSWFGFSIVLALLFSSLTQGFSKVIDDPQLERDVLDKYSDFFKTEEEIETVEKPSQGTSFKPASSEDRFRPQEKESVIDRGVRGNKIYHACCETESTFHAFDELENKDGEMVQLLEFADKKQFVHIETCSQAPDCNMPCTCAPTRRYFLAVYFNPKYPGESNKRTVMDFVSALISCKCLNNLARPEALFEERFSGRPSWPPRVWPHHKNSRDEL